MSEEFEKIIIERFDRIDERLDNVDRRLDNVDQRLDNVDRRLDNVDQRLNNVDRRLDDLDQRLDNVNTRIDEMYKTFDERIDTMNGTLVLLEHKMTTEFPSLYEIYSLNYELQKENEENLKTLEETTSKHSIQIENLYEIIKKSK